MKCAEEAAVERWRVDGLIRVLARASGSSGAILWEATEATMDGSTPTAASVVGLWFADGVAMPAPTCPDPATVEAFATRTLVMAAAGEETPGREPAVTAALPVEYLDGRHGALTLFGHGDLTGDSFDITVDLLDLLPALCAVHRRTIWDENRSWLLLAAGITAFNKLASEQLARTDPDDQRIYQAAVQIVHDVIPDCIRCDVYRASTGRSRTSRLNLVRSSDGPVGGRRPVNAKGGTTARVEPRPRAARPFAASVLRTGQQRATTKPEEITREDADVDAGWLACTPIQVSNQPYGVLAIFGRRPSMPANALQVCEIIGDQLGLYLHLRQALHGLREARHTLQITSLSQAEALQDLEHQLGGPLLVTTERVDLIIRQGRVDGRTESQLRAVRGLCRKAMRVAMSAGVFATLSKGQPLAPKLELLSADDLLRLLISGADDAQLLSNPRRRIHFEVEREGIRALGRRLIKADRSFVEQCVGNLLDNAAKYSYEDNTVAVRGVADDNSFAVSVTSTGLPVDPADADRCLQQSWRGPAARVATGEGSGLGLWIADQLMRSMKGTIRVRPVRDTTTVLLTFPLT